ncbi:CIC11C00000004744 [Sungouiella intermedia]|uniref:CIC11C00000004744 n=1 Tax=Sungouiella intermedia TaxID=45354 RepID=A0A1L0GLA2_9ASCO|nr:CIC11C00000004744 [[Candida] intermedia]
MSKTNLTFTWEDVSVSLDLKILLDNVSGCVAAGTMMALMGPSGSGKTTLLSVIARRQRGLSDFEILGTTAFGGEELSTSRLRQLSRFVEQEDHLIGSLTVKETVSFSARMATRLTNVSEITANTIDVLGLSKQANTKVGTPLQKGLSGGQKRRLSVAAQVVTQPEILFLDEPTSGLDSKASFEVVQTLKKFAQMENVVVIASIHQPSTQTFDLFDSVTFLSEGKVVYSGPRDGVELYFDKVNYPIPTHYNPAEYILDLINTDFEADGMDKHEVLEKLATFHKLNKTPCDSLVLFKEEEESGTLTNKNPLRQTWILVQRAFIKARRDYLAYYVRIVMYLGLAILMGTVWLRLGYTQKSIQPFTNAIFFSGAFMSFMSVAYIPAYLEDYYAYSKERSNGLYGPFPFVLSNFIIGIPFLFLIVTLFSIITYFLCNFRKSAEGFFMYVMYLFLNLLAAESLTILISTIFPIFVVALALTAFANGLWMAVGGFLVSTNVLNKFWYYTFYWVDYQRYAFQGMMFNQFEKAVFACGEGCHCMYTSDLESQCKISGPAVLKAVGYGNRDDGLWVGIMIVLIFVLRAATYVILKLRK